MPRVTARPDWVPKYRRHKPSGQAVVTIQGRDHYLGPWKSKASRAEYDRLTGEWLAAGRPTHQDRPIHNGLSVVELVAAYWEHAQGYYVKNGRPTGVLGGIRVALRFLKRHYGHTLAGDFGPLALEALRCRMVEAGHSRPYANSNIAHVKRVFRWGASKELVAGAVYQALATLDGLKRGRTPAREPEDVGPVAAEVVEATLPFLPPVVRDMVRFQRLAGCRPGEVCCLRPRDVDRSGNVWVYRPESHKTEHHDRKRVILIGPRAQAILLPYLLREADAYCFSPAESRRRQYEELRAQRKTRVQPSQRDRSKAKPKTRPGLRFSKDSYGRAVRRGCAKAAGLVAPRKPKTPATAGQLDRYQADQKAFNEAVDQVAWSPNQLRHSAATDIRAKYGLEAVQAVLGHAKANTSEIYAARALATAAAVMAEVG